MSSSTFSELVSVGICIVSFVSVITSGWGRERGRVGDRAIEASKVCLIWYVGDIIVIGREGLCLTVALELIV